MVSPLGQLHEVMTEANIVGQLAILVLLIVGFLYMRRRRYVIHGDLMFLAVIVNGLFLVMHMVPNFVLVLIGLEVNLLDPGSYIAIAHAIIGTLAEAFGVWMVFKWSFAATETRECMKYKRLMRWTMILWLTAIAIGFIYYWWHITFPAL
jgi:uncharacterized membrane protein YozB (DUF420 family)